MLAAGVDRSIRAWEVVGDSGTLTRSAFAHDGAVLRLVLAPDGQTLLSSGEDRAIKIWDLATLKPRASLVGQSDWPLGLAVSPEGSRIAVGRYDGSLTLLDGKTYGDVLTLVEPPGALRLDPKTGKPRLITNAALDPPSPRGATRGSTVNVVLSGNGVGQAHEVAFLKPGIEATIQPQEKPNPNRLEVEFKIAADALVGVHQFLVRTPLGTPASQAFAVAADPQSTESEPNDERAHASSVKLPVTLLGAIDRPGDVDVFRFEAAAETTVVFEALAKPLGSAWDGELAVLDESGKVFASAIDSDTSADPYLAFAAGQGGVFLLRVTDRQFGGSSNHFYRIRAGALIGFDSSRVRPLGVSLGSAGVGGAIEKDRPANVRWVSLQGPNLGAEAKLPLELSRTTRAGAYLPIDYKVVDGATFLTRRKVVVCATGSKSSNHPVPRAERRSRRRFRSPHRVAPPA